MGKRVLCLFLTLILFAVCQGGALGELSFPPHQTEQEAVLEAYIRQVNSCLKERNQRELDCVFECYPSFAVLGYGDTDVPEGTELSVQMSSGNLDFLELRMSDFSAFPLTCASLMACAEGTPEKTDELADGPLKCVQRAEKSPGTSFADEIIRDKGDSVRVYYRYEINPWGDQVSYLVMTLIFPRESGITSLVTPPPEKKPEKVLDGSDDDGDYTPYDDGTHLEVFLTPTPEPDSAAGYIF